MIAPERDTIIQYFGRHLVALCVSTRFGNEKDRFSAFPGTLIRVDQHIFWITAGHNLKHLYESISHPNVTLNSAVLADSFGAAYRSSKPVPIDLKNSARLYIDDDALGLDFGAILIHPHHERLIAANGIEILDENRWNHQSKIEYFGYLLLGLPEEYTSEFVPPSGAAELSPTIISIQKSPREGELQNKEYSRLIGNASKRLPLDSLKGMSGGPVFGFAGDINELRYWVVALQSSWLPADGTIFACPIPVLTDLLTRYIRGDKSALPNSCVIDGI